MREREILFRIYEFIKPYQAILVSAIICMVMVAISSASQAYMVKPLLDEIFFNKDRLLLNILPLALIILFVVKGLFFYGYSFLLNKVGQGIINDLRKRLYTHLQDLPLSFFHKTPTGEIISRIISDIPLIQNAVSQALVGTLKDCLQVICLLGVIFYQNWQLSLVSLVILPLAFFPIVLFGRKHRKLSTKSQQTTAQVSNILYETITGNRIVKAFCMEEYEIHRFSKVVNKLYNVTIRDARVRCLAHPIMELLGGIGIAFIMWYGGRQVLNGTSTPGTFFSFLTAIIMIYEPVKSISTVNSSVQQGIAAAIRIFGVLDTKPAIIEQQDAVPLPPLSGQIEFKDVCFSYDGKREVLKGINLSIKTGEVLAIVGSSGGGKTTLANLLPRFFDVTSGVITIDGHDIRDVTIKSLRGQIGLVTQQTILFNDTVRNNIGYGDQNLSENEIIAAAKAAHALDFITSLSEGFDTVIGESGTKLSGGERQRLSIARALLKDSPILILDEATSSLDTESEREIQKALDNLIKDRTTLIIAHRLSTIKNADRIIVIQDGRIVEEGTHETLLARNGVYTLLYNMQ